MNSASHILKIHKNALPTALKKEGFFAPSGYGYGLMMNPSAPTPYFHTGYVKGARSLTVYYPETKTSVIVLPNLADKTVPRHRTFSLHIKTRRIFNLI